ncbi:hypothetical protein [Rhodomicrobium lacus]|uniref:hypothetical protein n=1 Tax=Rhodomicrobium lacus TaxID=2498452 RepID=UPI000F8E0B50|nr:hypothetical protein [Rhodomicrobium lacus]
MSSQKNGKLSQNSGKLSGKIGKLSGPCAERAVAFLRATHPEKTAEAIEVETAGIVSADTARKWLAGSSTPNFRATMTLIAIYGPPFLAAVLSDDLHWVARAMRAERLAALEAEHARLKHEIETITRG